MQQEDLIDQQKKSPKFKVQKAVIYKDTEEEAKRIEVEKNIVARLLRVNGELVVDIRRFYRDYPTKKGVRLSVETFNTIKDLF